MNPSIQAKSFFARTKMPLVAPLVLVTALVSCAPFGQERAASGGQQMQSAGNPETKCPPREFPQIRGRAFYYPKSECERARDNECTVRGMGLCKK